MATPLGARIRELRSERGMTLAQTSAAAGISTSYLNDIEHGRAVPRLDRLVAIASVLGMTARELLTGVAPYDQVPPDH